MLMRSAAVLIAVVSLSISMPKSSWCALAEDSAQELSDKLAQLKALLDAKGEGADPELKARLDSLQGQLGALGLGDRMGGEGMAPSQEHTEFLTGCVAMSLRRAGAQRPATIGALRRLAEDKLSREEAAKLNLWKMVGACINDLTQQELEQFKAGKLLQLPKAYVEISKKPEAEEAVTKIDDGTWNELRTISSGFYKALLEDLIGNTEEQKPSGEQREKPPPVMFALMLTIPLLGVFAFLANAFMDMKKSKKSQ